MSAPPRRELSSLSVIVATKLVHAPLQTAASAETQLRLQFPVDRALRLETDCFMRLSPRPAFRNLGRGVF